MTFKDANLANPRYDTFEKDVAIVTFYFDKSSAFQFKRYERLTLTGYISQIGGLLGLAMGFSFVSAAEILYWIVVRFPISQSRYFKDGSDTPDDAPSRL